MVSARKAIVMSDTRKPLDNLLDELEMCASMIEEKIGESEIGVLSLRFNRDRAKQMLQDYISLLLVGRSG